MKHILIEGSPTIELDRYLEAFSEYRDRLPTHVADFGGDADRFTLSSPRSLHDAWLQRISVIEKRSNGDNPSTTLIELVLLGQMHDREIILTYDGVVGYSLQGIRNKLNPNDTFHGDIYTHEVRVSDSDLIVHEIAFVSGSCYQVECRDLRIEDHLF